MEKKPCLGLRCCRIESNKADFTAFLRRTEYFLLRVPNSQNSSPSLEITSDRNIENETGNHSSAWMISSLANDR